MRPANPYLAEVDQALPRLLALFDDCPASPTFGVGDRFYWAWKLTDFGNGTFQGAAHGLALLLDAGLLQERIDPGRILDRIDAMFRGAQMLLRRDGSLEEAFPYEGSFCVTALVAFDLMSAIDLAGRRLDASKRDRYVRVIRPMVEFLLVTDETHGLISNHLATAAAALVKWTDLTGEPTEVRGRALVERILSHASLEGWFREYEGADPGYQSLCMAYLTDLHRMRPGWGLKVPLTRAFGFLTHFVHPDGSFGGHYGARNTRFYFPAAAEVLAAEIPEAASLAAAMRRAVGVQRAVVLASMDEPNLVPMFNAYCRAAVAFAANAGAPPAEPVPSALPDPMRTIFPEAGLLIDRGPHHYTVISWKKGGVCYHFVTGLPPFIDYGLVVRDQRGVLYSSQGYDADAALEVSGENLVLTSRLTRVRQMLPTPLKFLVLRILSLTAFRVPLFAHIGKKALVHLLITGKRALRERGRRVISLGPNLAIDDDADGLRTRALERVDARAFSAIHMASQGYWQAGDDRL